MSSFRSETELARLAGSVFEELKSNFQEKVAFKHEVQAPGGIPDLVVFHRTRHCVDYVVTVEFKLRNWQRGLYQAFKNRNFGNESYLILDRAHLGPALKNVSEFERTNVGLASIEPGSQITVWYYPSPHLPFSRVFAERVGRNLLYDTGEGSEDLRFIRSVKGGLSLQQLRHDWSPR